MATASTTKTIILLGHNDQGKTTLMRALKTVLDARYGIGEEGYPFQYTIGNCCYQIFDLPSDITLIEFLNANGHEIDTAVYVCSINSVENRYDREHLSLCRKYGIKIACAYMSQVTEDTDEFMIEVLDSDVNTFIGSNGHPNTVKLTEDLTESYSASGQLFTYENCPILHGDSQIAIEDPFSTYGDVMVRLIHYIKVALWG